MIYELERLYTMYMGVMKMSIFNCSSQDCMQVLALLGGKMSMFWKSL